MTPLECHGVPWNSMGLNFGSSRLLIKEILALADRFTRRSRLLRLDRRVRAILS